MILFILAFSFAWLGAQAKMSSIGFMCLEICNGTEAEIEENLAQVAAHKGIFYGMAFERFGIDGEHQLVEKNVSDVAPKFQAMGLRTFPMVSSYPYPPQFLDWMRNVFTHREEFVAQLVSTAHARGYAGFNIDWEPVTRPLPGDAEAYAEFLAYAAARFHEEGLQLSVCVATWSTLWNITAISASGVDWILFMSTYASDLGTFERELRTAVQDIPSRQLVAGLECDKAQFTDAELKVRFGLLEEAQVERVGIWKLPIPQNWISFLHGTPQVSAKSNRF